MAVWAVCFPYFSGCQTLPHRNLSDAETAQFKVLLNSERIERRFGNYGIEVMAQSEVERISDLYSKQGVIRTTRTMARVEWIRPIDGAIAVPHHRVLEGGSIGATFKEAGWEVDKGNFTFFEEVPRTSLGRTAQRRMRIDVEGPPLAAMRYELKVSNGDRVIPYARITEIYHPDFLAKGDLKALSGHLFAGASIWGRREMFRY